MKFYFKCFEVVSIRNVHRNSDIIFVSRWINAFTNTKLISVFKMDLEYDRKFEEMKKYIPFLESMIKRLENTNTTSNPRQAQLNKIRSLRDLLMDKKKRCKIHTMFLFTLLFLV